MAAKWTCVHMPHNPILMLTLRYQECQNVHFVIVRLFLSKRVYLSLSPNGKLTKCVCYRFDMILALWKRMMILLLRLKCIQFCLYNIGCLVIDWLTSNGFIHIEMFDVFTKSELRPVGGWAVATSGLHIFLMWNLILYLFHVWGLCSKSITFWECGG